MSYLLKMTLMVNKNAISFMNKLKMKSLCRLDDKCEEIVFSVNEVCLFFFEKSTNEWLKDDLQGTFHLYKTNDCRKYSIIFLNNNALVDISSYKIHDMSKVELSLNETFVKVDRGGEFVLAFHFENTILAENCFNHVSNASNICKGINNVFTKPVEKNSINKNETTLFSASYSNEKLIGLFSIKENDSSNNSETLSNNQTNWRSSYHKNNTNSNNKYNNYNNNKNSNFNYSNKNNNYNYKCSEGNVNSTYSKNKPNFSYNNSKKYQNINNVKCKEIANETNWRKTKPVF